MAKTLTKSQRAILQFIVKFTQENGYPPSIREIQRGIGVIKSLRGITLHLDALQRKGYIERSSNARSIRVIHPDYQPERERVRLLPLVGTIAAGTPVLAYENVEDLIPVPADMVRNVENAFCCASRATVWSGNTSYRATWWSSSLNRPPTTASWWRC
jgi:SOS-response transcriptional repressors (RecA-mediated autopeptidases)